MIRLKDVLADMEKEDELGNPIPFSLKYVAYDREKQKGGHIIEIRNAVLLKSGKRELGKDPKHTDDPDQIRKNPHHWQNRTRNIVVLPSKQIRKVHIYLITRYNEQRVAY